MLMLYLPIELNPASTELFVHKDGDVCGVFVGMSLRKAKTTPWSVSMGFRTHVRGPESNLGLALTVLFQLRSMADRGLAPGV